MEAHYAAHLVERQRQQLVVGLLSVPAKPIILNAKFPGFNTQSPRF